MYNYNYKYKVTINILQKKQYFVQFDIDKRFLIMPKKIEIFFCDTTEYNNIKAIFLYKYGYPMR